MFEPKDVNYRDLAPWVADVLDGIARANGVSGGVMDDDAVRGALLEALNGAPRPVTLEELARGCAIATELMKAEVVELSCSVS